MQPVSTTRTRGSVLIISLGILLLLSVLAVSFSRLMRLERDVSSTYRAKVQARMLAVAGVEQAIASLQRDLARGDFAELASNAWPNSTLVGLAESGAVSFGDPDRQIDGVPYSGSLPATGEPGGLHPAGLQYQVRVLDTSQLVHLAEFPRHEEGVVRILDNLGDLLRSGFKEVVVGRDANARPVAQERTFRFRTLDGRLGTRLFEMSTSNATYRCWADVRDGLRRAYGSDIDDDLRLLERLVTFHGVTDPATVSPAVGAPVGQGSLRPAIVDHARAPIDVNRAGRLVLAATLLGLRAEYAYFDQSGPRANGQWKSDGVAAIDRNVALAVADAIIARREGRARAAPAEATHEIRAPFRTWEDFEGFLYRLADQRVLSPAQADTILANANPHPRPLRNTPDVYQRYRPVGPDFEAGWVPRLAPGGRAEHRWAQNRIWIDKSDLRQYTTEFCLESPGVYEIESVGRVLLASGEVMASHRIRAALRVGREVRLRTQAQFLRNAVAGEAENVVLGPESIELRRLPGQNVSETAGCLALGDAWFDGGQNFALARPGTFQTRTTPVDDTSEVYVYPDGKPVRVTMRANRSEDGALAAGGNRVFDGILARKSPDERFVKYDSKRIVPRGGLSFWVQLDEETIQRPGVGLFFATNLVPGLPDTAVQRLVYLHEGTLRVTTTWCSMRASVPSDVTKNEVRLSYSGELREDAYDRLVREGADWLRDRKPGADDKYYQAFGEHYARQVLTAISQGDTKVVKTYIYDAERVEGLGHLGCITKTTDIDGKIDTVFKPGTWKVDTVTKSTEAYLAEVNETAKFNYQFDSSMGVSQNDRANELLGQAEGLTNEAKALEAQARDFQDRASKLEQRADRLLQEAGRLEAEAATLAAQAQAMLEDDDEKNDAEAQQLAREAERKQADAAAKEAEAQALLAEAQTLRKKAREAEQEAARKIGQAAGKIEQASELSQEDASGLKLDYERVTKKGLENPNRFSRVECWSRKTRDWRPGEWHHVYVGWDDELNSGQFTVLLDNETPAFERRDAWGPLDVWGSRQVQLRNEFFPGAFTLRRASGESGRDDSIAGIEPRLSADLTLADYRTYDSFRANPPLAGRFDPDDSKFTLEFDLGSLEEWGGLGIPRGWTLAGTVTVRSREPKLGRTDGRAPDRMVRTKILVNGQAMGADGRLPAGLVARDADGSYRRIRTQFAFSARPLAGPYDTNDRQEANYQMHTPIVEEVVYRFVVPASPLLWEETDRVEP